MSRVEESSDTDNTKEEDYAEFGNEESVARLYIVGNTRDRPYEAWVSTTPT